MDERLIMVSDNSDDSDDRRVNLDGWVVVENQWLVNVSDNSDGSDSRERLGDPVNTQGTVKEINDWC